MISVIVPVYNCHRFLYRCVASLLNQSYKDFELILVDDGSTDSSGNLCEMFKLRDTRVRVLHKTNGGASSARNLGLDVAVGEYVAFVDADDWVDPNYLEMLVDPLLRDREVDIALTLSADNKTVGLSHDIHDIATGNGYVGKEIALLKLIRQKPTGIWAVWAKLYRKILFAELRFDESLRYGEDLIVNLEVFLAARRFFQIDQGLYHYCHENTESISAKANEVEYWKRFLKRYISFLDDGRILRSNIYGDACLLGLNLYELTINLYIFHPAVDVFGLKTFYETMGDVLLHLFNVLPTTTITKLQRRTIGTYAECISIISKLMDSGGGTQTLYIYGAGRMAKSLSAFLERNKIVFNSFIVSDGHATHPSPDGKHPVIQLSDVLAEHMPDDITILLALKCDYVQEVLPGLDACGVRNVFMPSGSVQYFL